MGADEEGTLERLKTLRRELLDPKISEHHRPIVKTTCDGMLVEFCERRRCGALRCSGAARNAGILVSERPAPQGERDLDGSTPACDKYILQRS